MTGAIAIIMVFSIPLTAIVTSHFRKIAKIKASMLRDEIELEKLRQQNFLLETEKMKLEVSQMKIGEPADVNKWM